MHAGGTAHIVPVPGVMGVKDFALTYSNILERYKFERYGRTFFWQRQNYSQAVLCLGINPHFREQNCERHKIYGAWEKRIHINEQTSWLLFFVAFGQPFSLWLEIDDGRKYMKDYCTKWLMDWRTTGGVVTTLEKSWPLHRNVGGGAEIMTVDWAALPNFFYLKTVIKLHWQNWPKTKHFPYLWPPAAEGDQAFLRHLSRLKTEPAAAQMSFSLAEKKNCSRCVDISSYRERVMVMALYGRMHFAQRICCIQTFFFNTAKTWQAHVHTGCFFNCFSPFSKWQNVLCQRGDFIHWIFPKIVALVGCNSFFILALKIEGSS